MIGGGFFFIILFFISFIIGGRFEIEIIIYWNILLLGKEGGEFI